MVKHPYINIIIIIFISKYWTCVFTLGYSNEVGAWTINTFYFMCWIFVRFLQDPAKNTIKNYIEKWIPRHLQREILDCSFVSNNLQDNTQKLICNGLKYGKFLSFAIYYMYVSYHFKVYPVPRVRLCVLKFFCLADVNNIPVFQLQK